MMCALVTPCRFAAQKFGDLQMNWHCREYCSFQMAYCTFHVSVGNRSGGSASSIASCSRGTLTSASSALNLEEQLVSGWEMSETPRPFGIQGGQSASSGFLCLHSEKGDQRIA